MMLKTVVNAANALKAANMIIDVLIDLLFAKTKSTIIAWSVALASAVVIVMVSFDNSEDAAEP